MSRYIDAEKLIEVLKEQGDYKAPNLTDLTNQAMTSAFRIAIREVLRQPTADVEEIRHAKWDDSGDEVHYCSNCNGDALFIGFVQIFTDYCPWCGTKMDL